MPDFVERLVDVQEKGCAIMLVFQCFIYYIVINVCDQEKTLCSPCRTDISRLTLKSLN